MEEVVGQALKGWRDNIDLLEYPRDINSEGCRVYASY
jgi:hypothetical protein